MASRILVVDDEPTVRGLVVRALQEEGYEVVAVADGMVGLETAQQRSFDLVVTNDCMPRMSGDELTARLRRTWPNLPILHISGRSPGVADNSLAGEYYLYKPFGPDALLQTVRTLLDNHARQQPFDSG